MPVAALEPAATLSKAELDALDEVGLSTKPWRDARATDPLAQSIVNSDCHDPRVVEQYWFDDGTSGQKFLAKFECERTSCPYKLADIVDD